MRKLPPLTQRQVGEEIHILHNNRVIVEVTKHHITLYNHDDYSTTTRRQLNQAAKQFNLGYHITQSGYFWYVTNFNGPDTDFYDGIKLER